MHERLCRGHSFLRIKIHEPSNDITEAFVLLCLGPLYEWLVRNVVRMPLIPQQRENLTACLVIANMCQQAIDAVLVPKVRHKPLKADCQGLCALRDKLLEIFVVLADHLVAHREDTLLLLDLCISEGCSL